MNMNLPTSGNVQRGIEDEIRGMVNRETEAWNTKNAEALVSLFHPDMIWPWPPDEHHHDPAGWIFPQGRYNKERWKEKWEELFRTHDLVWNERHIVRIVVSEEGDGAFAVVDVETHWRNRDTGHSMIWRGRACKGYTNVDGRWYLIFHTGLLEYPANA